MTDDLPTLRSEALRVLTGAPVPLGLAAISDELHLATAADRVGLAKALHKLRADGAVTALPAEKGNRFLYSAAPGINNSTERLPHPRRQRQPAPRPLQAALAELEAAIAALVKDDGLMALVRAYGALRVAAAP